ncbi:olfactory receptor 478-like [Dipodomys spectabilis]|uniref:olfactory receptor 478-like n=1 Tax=Dipodomys spectabilis TaxID=105255 RepID=UPI001C542BF7|nr:olfactory receptor 478-like [Dipodomys spectabilis]
MDSLVDGNHTAVTEFILLGLTHDPVLRVILFLIILCIYLVTVSGNLCTILLIRLSSLVNHPMYFFLSHLAFADIALSTSVTPNMLVNFLMDKNAISLHGCAFQLGSVAVFGATDCLLLAAMAYDRFMAICNPLLYSTKMSSQVCVQLIMVAYAGGFLNGCTFTTCVYVLPFCGPNRVNHFFCDFAPLVELSCSDVSIITVVASSSAGSSIMFTAIVIAISYIYILTTILKMRSTEGRHKAFSTCTSHLSAVTLYYGTITFIYVLPKSMYSTDQNKVISVFYMVVIPMLNPLIYSLRNKDIKEALKRQMSRKIFS